MKLNILNLVMMRYILQIFLWLMTSYLKHSKKMMMMKHLPYPQKKKKYQRYHSSEVKASANILKTVLQTEHVDKNLQRLL